MFFYICFFCWPLLLVSFLLNNFFFYSSYCYFIYLPIDSDSNFKSATKGSRINWGRSPHHEEISKAILDCTKKEVDTLDVKGKPFTSKAIFASKFGISWKLILLYIHPYQKSRNKLAMAWGGRLKSSWQRILSLLQNFVLDQTGKLCFLVFNSCLLLLLVPIFIC